MLKNCVLLLVGGALAAFVGCSGDDDETGGGGDDNTVLRIGALYPDDGGGSDSADAIRMAVADINESGVLDVTLEVVPKYFNDDSDRGAQATELMRDYGVVALASAWSSTALTVLRLTNSEEYANIIQCSGSSTNTTINNPETAAEDDGTLNSDQNGTLFRTTANDIQQAALLWTLVEDGSKLGVYALNDAYGSSFRDQMVSRAGDSGLGFDATFENDLNISDEQSDIATILDANAAGNLSALVLVGLPNHGSPIVKELVSATVPFSGTILVPDGMLSAGFFASLDASFTAWLSTAGNAIYATAPEMYEGANSGAWTTRLETFDAGVDLSNAFLPSHADCAYMFGLSLLKAGGDVTKLKDMMATFGATSVGADATEITPNAAGFQAAKAALDAGETIVLNGASGLMTWDADGDRAVQLYKTMAVQDDAGSYSWVQDKVWNAATGECVKYCD
jgi:hypothetical protein